MLIDIQPEEFDKMARAGFLDNVHLRAQILETARERCKSLGLRCVDTYLYRTGFWENGATDVYYKLVFSRSGFWLVKQKNE
ncbi:MAG: hypothetical protein DBX59_03550 [Bacillota bacterium]|nr:MAG: hypothetical protein DBX59_03550 [Bacillota bacterium]